MARIKSGSATAEASAPIMEAERSNSARPHSAEAIYVTNGDPRPRPTALPDFPNPSRRPEGAGPAVVLQVFSRVPSGLDIALGRAPKRDPKPFLQAIREAGDRSICVEIHCAGGEAGSALVIATALLQHRWRVRRE